MKQILRLIKIYIVIVSLELLLSSSRIKIIKLFYKNKKIFLAYQNQKYFGKKIILT